MIVILKNTCTQSQYVEIEELIKSYGLDIHRSDGESTTIIGLVGDVRRLPADRLLNYDGIESIVPVSTPYKMASRLFQPLDTIIDVDGVRIGGKSFVVMAGPCSVEGEEQIVEIAKKVKAAGASILRGGAFKPRTSPYAFQGMGVDGLKLLKTASIETGMPVVTEVMSIEGLNDVYKYADIIQIGARNMQNFELLKAVGKIDKPVLLKRGLSAKIEELLMSAEYIMSEGNRQVILCERGIRTFETATRNTLDLSAVPVLQSLTHLPVIVDPSHGTGRSSLVEPMAKCAVVSGANGLMIEVHNDPKNALCDGDQALRPEEFSELMKKVKRLSDMECKTLIKLG